MLASAGFSVPRTQICIRIKFRRVPSLRRLPFRKQYIFICTGDRPLSRRRPHATPARFPRLQASVIDRIERRPWYSGSTRNSLFIKFQVRVRLVEQLGPFGGTPLGAPVRRLQFKFGIGCPSPLQKFLFARSAHCRAQTCKVPLGPSGPASADPNVSWAPWSHFSTSSGYYYFAYVCEVAQPDAWPRHTFLGNWSGDLP